MITFKNGCAAAALALALPMAAISAGHAAPLAPSQSLVAAHASADNSLLTEVQYRRRGWGGGGAGLGIGLAAGALLGGAIAAGANPYYGPGYGYGPGYYGGPTYYREPVVVAPSYGYGGDAEAYCMRRYRSYDPASGTYLNNDGNRYPCP